MIYFDNAATSWPKPQTVQREVEMTLRYRGGNPSRGGHPLSMAIGRVLFRLREALAEHFGTEPERVVFTPGATYSLNFALKSSLKSGDHVLVSNVEHNAVLRPLHAMEKWDVSYSVFDALLPPDEMLLDIQRKLRPRTRMICCTHTANTVPLTLPIGRIGALCKEKDLLFVLDAAQSAGHIPIDMEKMNVDALCIPGHKGLLGPQGCGALLLSRRMAEILEQADTLIEGGSGILSHEKEMPRSLPERLEAGTLPSPALAGLLAGLQTVKAIGYEEIAKREHKVYGMLRRELMGMRDVTLYLPEKQTGNIILFNVKGIDADRAGQFFDQNGICLRAGFHCAPMAHKALMTGEQGALRLGIGVFNTERDAEGFLRVLERCKNALG